MTEPFDPSKYPNKAIISNGSPFWIPSAKNDTPEIFYSIALVIVVLRLLACFRKRAISGDDILAAVGGTFSTVLFAVFVRLYKSNADWRYMFGGTPIEVGHDAIQLGNPDQPLAAPAWAWIMFHRVAIWATRASFAYTIWLSAQTEKAKRISKWTFFALVAGWVVSSIEVIFVCDSHTGINAVCPLPLARALLFDLVFDIVATGWLFVWAVIALRPTLASCFLSVAMPVVHALQLSMIGVSAAYLAYRLQYSTLMIKTLWHIQAPLCVMLYNLSAIAIAFVPAHKAPGNTDVVHVNFNAAQVEAAKADKGSITRNSEDEVVNEKA